MAVLCDDGCFERTITKAAGVSSSGIAGLYGKETESFMIVWPAGKKVCVLKVRKGTPRKGKDFFGI